MKRLALALGALLVPAAGFAQTLADQMPADAVLYLGFKGTAALQGQYEKSHLKPIIEGTDLNVLASERFHERLGNVITRADDELGVAWPAIAASFKQMSQYPTAFAIAFPNKRPEFMVKCDAGVNAAALLEQLKSAMPDGTSLQLRQDDSIIVLSSGATNAKPAQSLAQHAPFADAMKQVDKDAAVVCALNVDAFVAAIPEPDAQERRRALGLEQVTMAAFSGSFSGENWSSRGFIAAPAERHGLAALLNGKPLSDEALKLVPKTALNVDAIQLDLVELFSEARTVMQQVEPDGGQQFDRGMGMLQSLIGMDVRTELFPALGTEWVCYTDANIGSTQSLGTVFANRLRDPAKAEAALKRLQTKLLTYGRAGAQTQGMSVSMIERQVGPTKIYAVGLPLITPAWAIRDGVLYVGFYPQVVAAAADFTTSGSPSILDTPAMQAAASAGNRPQSVSYTDLPRAIDNGYGIAMALSRYIGMLDLMTGVETPIMPLPTIPVMKAHSAPTLTTTWSDAAGWHLQSTGPFPGSRVLGGLLTADVNTMQAPIMASILLPSLARAREKANQVKCASNLRQIGQGIMLFSQDHQFDYPDSLGEMMTAVQMSPQVLLCPSQSSAVPADVMADPAELEQWADLNADYVYIGKGLRINANPETIVAYEEPGNHSDGANVLFADGHVEFMTHSALQQALDRQNPQP